MFLFDEIGVFYRGLMLGLMIAAPVGPVGLLCIRRTLQKGPVIGFASGFGSACADTVFGCIAALGVSAILDFIHHYEAAIRLVGGILIFASAWHTWHDHPEPPKPSEIIKKVVGLTPDRSLSGALRAFISGLALTLANPVTLFATLAVVATFGGLVTRFDAAALVTGIFCGSTLWWMVLSGSVTLLRCHFTESRIITVNRVTALALSGLAAWAVVSAIKYFTIRAI
jgi:threonine/homoserine/homoserine lactone efflux protein